jgi:hypothetical protein
VRQFSVDKTPDDGRLRPKYVVRARNKSENCCIEDWIPDVFLKTYKCNRTLKYKITFFGKTKCGLWDRLSVCLSAYLSVCLCTPLTAARQGLVFIWYCDMSTSCLVARQGLRSGALLGSRPLNNSRPNTRWAAVRGGGVFFAQPRWRHATALEYVSCEQPRWRHTAARSLPR